MMDLKAVATGLKATLIASSCCTLPLALALILGALGAGSMGAALSIAQYKYHFMALGTAFLAASTYLNVKKSCGGSCTLKDVKKQKTMIAASIVTYVVATAAIVYLILPAISAAIYG